MAWHYSSDDEEEDYVDYSLTSIDELECMYIGAIPYKNPETISRELKEFWVYPSMNDSLKESQIRAMFEHNDFSPLLPHIEKRLSDMIEQYVPKYLCTFLNSRMKEGELIFGINDGGEVTGVLMNANTTVEDIRTMVWRSIQSCIESSFKWKPSRYLEYYRNAIDQIITVNMAELSTDPADILIDDWHQEYLEKQQHRIDQFTQTRDQYLQKKRYFLSMFEFYRRGVVTMINDTNTHNDLIDYVRTRDIQCLPLTGKPLQLDDPIREEIVKEIQSIQVQPVSYYHGQICDEKNDPRNLAFWITRFRDHHCREIMKLRPPTPMLFKPSKLYKGLLQRNPVARIASGINHDPRLKVVIIQIILPGNLSFLPFQGSNYHPFFSFQDSTGEMKTPFRTLNGNGPSCV